MSEEIGTVISNLEGPSPSTVDFVVNKGKVHRGQFVEMDYSEGTIVALVNDVMKTNRYFERADSVKEFESNGSALFEQFPTAEWEYLVAKTRPLGFFSGDNIKRVTFPPSPGTRVRIASNENLERFLNFDKEAGLLLGEVEHHSLPVKLNMSSLLKKHLAILSLSGGGKSHSVAVILEELLDRKKEHGKIAAIVFDPHGEYSSFAETPKDKAFKDYSGKTRLVKARGIKIGVPKLSVGVVSGIIPGLSAPQKRDLGRILEELKKQMKEGLGPFDLNDLKDAISRDETIKENSKGPLLGWLHLLHELRLFGKTDNPSIVDLIKPGQLTIVDLSDTINLKKKQVIVSYFSQRIFNERRSGNVPPFLMVLEEAHQFCLSEDTEILTTKGWKNYTELKKGATVFSYNKDKNRLEANPVEKIIVRKHSGNLVKLFNEDSIDSLVTDDHRVLCFTRTNDKNKNFKWSDPKFVLAKNLPTGFKIPIVAQMGSNSKCDIDTDLVKILGWIITDGTLHDRKHLYYKIFQSKSKGGILEEMSEVIKRRFPEASVYSRKRKPHFYNSRRIRGCEEFTFYLGKKPGDEIRPWLGRTPHRIPREFLEKASLSQLKTLFNALVQGDGHIQTTKNNYKYIMFYVGHNTRLADDFQELCVRLGLSATIKKVRANKQTKVLVSLKRKFAFVRKITREKFSGKVWDITIKHGAFIARRNGKVFITGNCPQFAKEETAISRSIVRTIAREGRKFGASLCLVSQRPVQLDTTALSQCNTHIILRITNPYDLKHIAESSEGLDNKSIDMITSLRVGEALIVGEATHFPLFFKVRERKSMPSRHEKSLEQAALEFSESSEARDAETEELL